METDMDNESAKPTRAPQRAEAAMQAEGDPARWRGEQLRLDLEGAGMLPAADSMRQRPVKAEAGLEDMVARWAQAARGAGMAIPGGGEHHSRCRGVQLQLDLGGAERLRRPHERRRAS